MAPLRFRVVHGYRRAYRMAGSGPAILFIHGISDNSATWNPILPALSQRYTVIAPDLLGHGASDKPRADYAAAAYACGMRDLLTVLDVERVTVVGHSLGAGVAMQFAYQFPERCERLVLVGSGGVGRGVHPLLRAAAAPGSEFVLPLVTSLPVRGFVRAFLPLAQRVFDVGPDVDYVWDRYVALRDRGARTAFLRTLRSVVDARGQVVTMLDRCYLTKGMPTLVIWGAKDRIVPAGHARLAKAAMPGARLEIFEDAGHFPHHSSPDRFAAVLTDFMESTAPASHDPAQWRAILREGRWTEPEIEDLTYSSGS